MNQELDTEQDELDEAAADKARAAGDEGDDVDAEDLVDELTDDDDDNDDDDDDADADSEDSEDSEDSDDDASDDDASDDDASDDDDDDDDADDEVSDTASALSAEDPDVDPRDTAYRSDRAFTDFPLSPEIIKGIEEKGYKLATRVQALTLEPALAGKDLVVRSKTGTGKTAAFCIPILELIPAGTRKTRALVLAPTRELARQIAQEATELARYKDLRIAVIYGGVPFGPQEDALREGAELVVGTPGRIIDHLRRGNLDLSEAAFACLDEADEMLSMGFLEDVTKILDKCPADRQVMLFSATVDDRVRALITRYTRDALDFRISTDEDRVEGIEHILYETSPDYHKARALLAVMDIEQPSSAIIFCNTREDTATVATFLARQGLDVELISGELPQSKREKVMNRVKRGETQFLVATDVAARGIDISDLSHVINYSLPEDPKVYLHRTGRTGRIGKKGTAISLAGGSDLHTRAFLENQHGIAFEVRDLPTSEEAARARVERQALQIRDAMGKMAFEGYLSTVRAIKERPDADLLFAAALRAFFLWDRIRRAEEEGTAGSIEALHDAREERDDRRRDGGGRDSDRGRGRGQGGDRGRGGGGRDRDRDRDRGRSRGRDRDRPAQGDRPAHDDRPARNDAAAVEGSAPAPESGSDGGRERKRRRRRRSNKPNRDG